MSNAPAGHRFAVETAAPAGHKAAAANDALDGKSAPVGHKANGTLYLVATPIGNLEDISLRALRILREVSLIAAEDTRRTRQLLNHFNIQTPAVSYHTHSPPSRAAVIMGRLEAGQDIALVTDAGTPGISDPGADLVSEAAQRGIVVTPAPGACALIAALVASGLPTTPFVFEGFLPRTAAGRRRAIERLRLETRTLVLYEAPHRVAVTLRELAAVLGPRPTAVAREMTKLHEQIWRGSLVEAAEKWRQGARGEFVLVIGGAAAAREPSVSPGPALAEELMKEAIRAGSSRRDAARMVSDRLGMSYRELYRLAVGLDHE